MRTQLPPNSTDLGFNAILAFGANAPGRFGAPAHSLVACLRELGANGVEIKALSSTYSTKPFDGGSQLNYLNVVALVHSRMPPYALLRQAKALERTAGRRFGRRNGPRPLDVDIIAFYGQRIGWGRPKGCVQLRRPGDLIVPHPAAANRAFVLAPLLEVAPGWVHPTLGRPGRELLARIPNWRSQILRIDPPLRWD